METHHVGMKISIHPGGHTEVEMHHMPGGSDASNGGAGAGNPVNTAVVPHADMSASPKPGVYKTGTASFEGHATDNMASGMKHAMDSALSKNDAPIQKPDATRGGTEDKRNAAKQPDANISKKAGATKAPKTKTVPGKGLNVKNTSAARDKK